MRKVLLGAACAGALLGGPAATAASAAPNERACANGHGTQHAHATVPHANHQAHMSIPHYCEH